MKIDRLDSAILARLMRNGRTGVADLARELGVARNTVAARIEHLESAGVIWGYAARIDLGAIGFDVEALVDVQLDQRRLDAVVEALSTLPEVMMVRTLAGQEDLQVFVAAESHAALLTVVTAIIHLEGVEHTTTKLIVSTPLPYRMEPLLEQSSRDKGFGRAAIRDR